MISPDFRRNGVFNNDEICDGIPPSFSVIEKGREICRARQPWLSFLLIDGRWYNRNVSVWKGETFMQLVLSVSASKLQLERARHLSVSRISTDVPYIAVRLSKHVGVHIYRPLCGAFTCQSTRTLSSTPYGASCQIRHYNPSLANALVAAIESSCSRSASAAFSAVETQLCRPFFLQPVK
jgi:hypothetical protein